MTPRSEGKKQNEKPQTKNLTQSSSVSLVGVGFVTCRPHCLSHLGISALPSAMRGFTLDICLASAGTPAKTACACRTHLFLQWPWGDAEMSEKCCVGACVLH